MPWNPKPRSPSADQAPAPRRKPPLRELLYAACGPEVAEQVLLSTQLWAALKVGLIPIDLRIMPMVPAGWSFITIDGNTADITLFRTLDEVRARYVGGDLSAGTSWEPPPVTD
jgi:hypothetical protein